MFIFQALTSLHRSELASRGETSTLILNACVSGLTYSSCNSQVRLLHTGRKPSLILLPLAQQTHTRTHTRARTEKQRSRWMFSGRQRERFSTWGILYNGSVVILHLTHTNTHCSHIKRTRRHTISILMHTHTHTQRWHFVWIQLGDEWSNISV